jgi:hypothetical protein
MFYTINHRKFWGYIAHNVSAVCDVFAGANKGFAKQRPGLAKYAGATAWE